MRFYDDMMMSFVFSDTAAPESYTYGHTLSLRDALPIYVRVRIERDLSLVPPPHREISQLCGVGDSGSAKTTTLAQIAALARAESPDESFALLAADHRLGAREQLRVIEIGRAHV